MPKKIASLESAASMVRDCLRTCRVWFNWRNGGKCREIIGMGNAEMQRLAVWLNWESKPERDSQWQCTIWARPWCTCISSRLGRHWGRLPAGQPDPFRAVNSTIYNICLSCISLCSCTSIYTPYGLCIVWNYSCELCVVNMGVSAFPKLFENCNSFRWLTAPRNFINGSELEQRFYFA